MNQQQTMQEYIDASCGAGKYYSTRLVLLRKLKKTKSLRWCGFNTAELREHLEQSLKSLGINTEDVA